MSELKTESFSAGHRWGGWANYICATGAVLVLAVHLALEWGWGWRY